VYDIPKGRKDGRRSKIEDTINLPFPTFNASELIRSFAQRGFSAQEMVALSGRHSLLNYVESCSRYFKLKMCFIRLTLTNHVVTFLLEASNITENLVYLVHV